MARMLRKQHPGLLFFAVLIGRGGGIIKRAAVRLPLSLAFRTWPEAMSDIAR
jgi:hypothetical protein